MGTEKENLISKPNGTQSSGYRDSRLKSTSSCRGGQIPREMLSAAFRVAPGAYRWRLISRALTVPHTALWSLPLAASPASFPPLFSLLDQLCLTGLHRVQWASLLLPRWYYLLWSQGWNCSSQTASGLSPPISPLGPTLPSALITPSGSRCFFVTSFLAGRYCFVHGCLSPLQALDGRSCSVLCCSPGAWNRMGSW